MPLQSLVSLASCCSCLAAPPQSASTHLAAGGSCALRRAAGRLSGAALEEEEEEEEEEAGYTSCWPGSSSPVGLESRGGLEDLLPAQCAPVHALGSLVSPLKQ